MTRTISRENGFRRAAGRRTRWPERCRL